MLGQTIPSDLSKYDYEKKNGQKQYSINNILFKYIMANTNGIW